MKDIIIILALILGFLFLSWSLGIWINVLTLFFALALSGLFLAFLRKIGVSV